MSEEAQASTKRRRIRNLNAKGGLRRKKTKQTDPLEIREDLFAAAGRNDETGKHE